MRAAVAIVAAASLLAACGSSGQDEIQQWMAE